MKPTLHFRTIAAISFILITNLTSAQCWQKITTGLNHTIGIRDDGSLWAWGFDGYAQLGNAAAGDSDVPIAISGDTDWKDISSGENFNMAIRTDGTLWGWGVNLHGEIGNGINDFMFVPSQVGNDTDWLKVSAGHTHTVAIKTDGTLWGWGENSFGQVGDGSNIERGFPVQIGTANDWITISAGFTHNLALKADGTLWAWGQNSSGQLGNNSTAESHVPVQMGTATDWSEIAAAQYHSKAIRSNGTLWSWGSGLYGLNGDGTGSSSTGMNKMIPTQIGSATDWSKVAAGVDSAAAIKTTGALYTWGKNDNGQLGDGTYLLRNTPTLCNAAVNCVGLAGGNGFHYFALRADGSLWTWGLNVFGQLGDDTEINRISPVSLSCMILSAEEITDTAAISIYPNPARETINIDVTDQTINSIELYDLVGKMISKTAPSAAHSQINISNLAKAVYIMRIYTDKGSYLSKIIKE
jgi:alpha-tubulin suppressor-like RCC1 family protein